MTKTDAGPVSMTTFVDFVLKAGIPKTTVVRDWKYRPEYSPATDFYRPLREAICEKASPHELQEVVDRAPPAKRVKFREMANGYLKWLKSKAVFFPAPRQLIWQSSAGLQVRVNPELDVQLGANPRTLVKMVFKSERVTKQRADLALQLMLAALGNEHRPTRVVGLLDVRESKLFFTQDVVPLVKAQLSAEAAYWQDLWPHV